MVCLHTTTSVLFGASVPNHQTQCSCFGALILELAPTFCRIGCSITKGHHDSPKRLRNNFENRSLIERSQPTLAACSSLPSVHARCAASATLAASTQSPLSTSGAPQHCGVRAPSQFHELDPDSPVPGEEGRRARMCVKSQNGLGLERMRPSSPPHKRMGLWRAGAA